MVDIASPWDHRVFEKDSNLRFDNLCGSHLQSQGELYHVS